MFWRTTRGRLVTGLVALSLLAGCGSSDAIGATKQTGKVVSVAVSTDGSCSFKLKATKGRQSPAPSYRGNACQRALSKANYQLTDNQYIRVDFRQTFAMVKWRRLPFSQNEVPAGAACRIVISRWEGIQNISDTIFADAPTCDSYVYGKPYTRPEWSAWTAPAAR